MPERLGRYILDRRIATGGMAEVFLARQSGPQGYERTCVIKRMLPHFSGDPTFVSMFLDEARLAAQLTHANIAQIYDFGAEGKTYYLAMEYVAGATLRDVMTWVSGQARQIPFRATAKIISDAARALDYAHSAKDAFGKPLAIIHRDVSPHNILVARAGTVKLIDFGIAKAASAHSQTTTGTVKGKYAYMSPEQAQAHPLDRRTDIYSLGLVFYELLTNAKALKGDSMPALMVAASRPALQPIEELRADVPPVLAQICRKAVNPERDGRHGSAGQLSAELERYLVSEHTTVGESDLSVLVPPDEDADPHGRPTVDMPRLGAQPPVSSGGFDPTYITSDTKAEESAQSRSGSGSTRVASRGPGKWIWAVGLVAVIGGGVGGAWFFRHPPDPQPLPVADKLPGLPTTPPPAPAPAPPAPPPSPPVLAKVDPPVADPPAPHSPKVHHPPAPATLTVSASAPGQVSIDGHAPSETPLKTSLPPGDHTLVFKSKELGLEQTRRIHLSTGEQHDEQFRVAGKGSVEFRALPYAEVYLGEKKLGITPLKPIELPEGHYRFRLANSETGKSELKDVDVSAGKRSTISVDLRGD